jgi:hypothetical protein
MRPRTIITAALLLLLTACAQPSQAGSSEEDFARGIARGYERALEDISDCAKEDGGMEDFRDCVANGAIGISINFLDESQAEQTQRGEDASSEAFQIWSGLLLRMGS